MRALKGATLFVAQAVDMLAFLLFALQLVVVAGEHHEPWRLGMAATVVAARLFVQHDNRQNLSELIAYKERDLAQAKARRKVCS